MTLTWQERMDALTALHIGVEVRDIVLDTICDLLCVPKVHRELGYGVDGEFIDEWLAEVEREAK